MQILISQSCLSSHRTAASCLLVLPCEGSQLQWSYPCTWSILQWHERKEEKLCLHMILILIKKKKSKEIKCLRSLRCSYLVSQIFLCEKKMVFKKPNHCAFSAHLFPFCLLIGERENLPSSDWHLLQQRMWSKQFSSFFFKLIGRYLVNWRLVSIAVKWGQSLHFCKISKYKPSITPPCPALATLTKTTASVSSN